jgi:ferredoxin-thioredoxin reductase catalytic subunit
VSGQARIAPAQVNRLYARLRKEAESVGYNLNPDVEVTKELVKGLLINQKRYGYPACPCRLASAEKEADLDIICPCDYRDADLTDYNSCYCGLYVSKAVVEGKKMVGSIPERRPLPEKRREMKSKTPKTPALSVALPVWRCKVCGYLCAREKPPEICPICKAKKERFERFL